MNSSANPVKTRRGILKAGLAAIAAPTIIPATSLGQGRKPPSDRHTIGVIGLGSRGFNLIDELLPQTDAQIVMICDVDTFHYRDQAWGKGKAYGSTPAKGYIEKNDPSTKGLRVTKDYREVCAADDIDAVVIATPDHWHAFCTLDAMKNGKDVYCEKPVTHTFAEGQLVYNAAEKHDAVFQTGSQQRSHAEFRKAVELIRNGHLGALRQIEVGLNPGYDQPQGDVTVQHPPEHLDYEMWCGPAPKLPYMRARHHRWWRGHRAFGGGVLMDWIGHHNDIAHWAMDLDHSGPTEVEAVGWTYPENPVYNTPHQYDMRCKYSSGVESSISSRHKNGVMFRGDDGWVFVTRGKLEASDKTWVQDGFDPGDQKVYRSDNHMRNFLDCITTRESCISPAEATHRSITPGHLGYVSQALGRPLNWNSESETIVGDNEAMKLLMQSEYRDPWG